MLHSNRFAVHHRITSPLVEPTPPGGVQNTDQAATLRALRNDLAARMDACQSDQNYSTMARVLVDVMAAIAKLSQRKPSRSPLDELARRRAAAKRPDASRRTAAKRPGNAGPGA